MHFQDTEYVTSHMAIEPALNVMYGVSGDTRSLQESVTVHSMSADAGMLAIKYKMPLPAAPQPQQRQPGQPPLRMGTKVSNFIPYSLWCTVTQACASCRPKQLAWS